MAGVREINPTDADGNSFRLYVLPDGLILPVFPGILERVEKLKTFIPKEDDVFLFGFPKSGTHWTWEIVNMLLRGKADYMSYDKDEYMVDHCDLSVLETRPGPRVINSHLPFRYIPQGVLRGGNKIIHVVRNPKDAMVSYYNLVYNYKAWGYNGTWSAFLDMVYKGQLTWLNEGGDWFDYEKEWEQAKDKYPDVPILYVYYEDLHQDPISTVKAISEFLGVECSQGFCEEVIEKCSFNSMKAARKPFEGEEERWRNGEQKVFLNGKIGTWKKWFTVQQSEVFKNLYAKKLRMSPFKSKYVYP